MRARPWTTPPTTAPPVYVACQNGHLSVCKFEVARPRISQGEEQWLHSHVVGHLSVCKWLFEVARPRTSPRRTTPAAPPCRSPAIRATCRCAAVRGGRGRGHHRVEQRRRHSHAGCLREGLAVGVQVAVRGGRGRRHQVPSPHLRTPPARRQPSVCKWLFEVGAADITKATNSVTPMLAACEKGHLPVCKWLFEVGAARTSPRRASTASLPCTSPAIRATCRCASGCSRWVRPRTSPRRASRASLPCPSPARRATRRVRRVGAAADVTKAASLGSTPCPSPARVATCRCASG